MIKFFKKIVHDTRISLKTQEVYQSFEKWEESKSAEILNAMDGIRLLERKMFHEECPNHPMAQWVNAWPLDKLSPIHFKNEDWIQEVRGNKHAARLYLCFLATSLWQSKLLSVHYMGNNKKINKDQWIETHQALMDQIHEFWSLLPSKKRCDFGLMHYGGMIKEPLEFLSKIKAYIKASQGSWSLDQSKQEGVKNQKIKQLIKEKTHEFEEETPSDFNERISTWHERLQVEVMNAPEALKVQEYRLLIRRCFQEIERIGHRLNPSLKELQKKKIKDKMRDSMWREWGVDPSRGQGKRQMMAPAMQKALIEALHQWSDEELLIKEKRETLKNSSRIKK